MLNIMRHIFKTGLIALLLTLCFSLIHKAEASNPTTTTITYSHSAESGICPTHNAASYDLPPPNNTPPTLVANLAPSSICFGDTYRMTFTASDPDGDNITISMSSIVVAPTTLIAINNGSSSVTTGEVNFIPLSTEQGLQTFTIVVTDDGSPNASSSFTFSVFVDNCCDYFDFDLEKASDPCDASTYEVFLRDDHGDKMDGSETCLFYQWLDENGNTLSNAASFNASPDIRYTARVTNTCNGCTWEGDFWECCEVLDPAFTISTQCTADNFIITATNTTPTNNSRFYVYTAHSPCVSDNCLVDFQNPDQKEDGNIVTFTLPKSCGTHYMIKHGEWSHCDWAETRRLVTDDCCRTPENLNCIGLGQPMLSWDKVCDHEDYQVEIRGNDPFCCMNPLGTSLGYIAIVRGTSYQVPVLNGGYDCVSWRVRTVCGPGEFSEWSPKQCVCGGGKHNRTDAGIGAESLSTYPSPANHSLTVSGSAVIEGATINLYDLSGKTVLAKKVDAVGEQKIDIRALPNGVYYLRLEQQGLVQTAQKVIIQH